MSIAPLNRSACSLPLSSASQCQPVSSPVQGLERTSAQQPGNALRQRLMADSFEQGPRGLGDALGAGQAMGAAGGAEKTQLVAQALGELMQLLQSLQAQLPGAAGGVPDAAAGAVGGVGGAASAPQAVQAPLDAPKAQGSAAAASTSNSPDTAKHPTYASEAGPGFGPPSAGSTEQVNPSEPWLARNNVGTPYNSNMLLIDPSQKSQYKYTNTFTNKTDKPQTITLWNKTGETGNPNDGQHFDKSTPKTFTLQPGQSQLVAFDTNSSVAWCVSKDGTANPEANYGQTWGEATFANAGTGWSGYDTSQISPAGHSGRMSISNEASGHTVTEANAWQTPSDNPAGKDVGVPAGPLHLNTVFS
ncbi:hypothetical protein [Hyalangium gracile]|uniref:hypothetical protein n=1 Tax=Hyalangium gracile TaxID=394092 RepID=UPI001CCBF71B|nr:hypothetical protein [Hyalangium gracile]